MTEMDQIRHSIDEIDQEMARLFEQRMDAVQRIAQWKMQSGLPVEDAAREETLFRRNESSLTKENYRLYYAEVLKAMVHQSKRMRSPFIAAVFNMSVSISTCIVKCWW